MHGSNFAGSSGVPPPGHRERAPGNNHLIRRHGGIDGWCRGQVGLGALSDNRSFSAGYVVGGGVTVVAIPILVLLRRWGGPGDLLSAPDDAGSDQTCPAGLPRVTGVEALPVPLLTDP